MSKPEKTLLQHAEDDLNEAKMYMNKKLRMHPRTKQLQDKATANMCFEIEIERIAEIKKQMAIKRMSTSAFFDDLLRKSGI
ncbi:hypothetical protein [Geminicoccus roseus]|uniref:hypothetical protein n=1 Tax=Geminicoccus roseus TaxID=404900 RepID=UPI0012F7672E|nr:hypothetical protein [Geminicoccus roseus]